MDLTESDIVKLSKTIDHTLLKPFSQRNDIYKLCMEAKEYDFASVCVNPCWVEYAKNLLEGTNVKICTVIGFPLGATFKEVKVQEAKLAADKGCTEVDMVINIGKLKDKEYGYVKEEIKEIVKVVKGKAVVKVIIETCLLTDEEKIKACKLSVEAGAAFVKTSTGFSTGGATIEDVKLMKKAVKDNALVKASTGIKTYGQVKEFIKVGAVRFGTSSGIKILQERMNLDE